MVQLTDNKIIFEIETHTPGEDLKNIQKSLLMGIQLMNPELNPMDLEINPVYWLSVLIEHSLPDLKNYVGAYSPNKQLILPDNLTDKQAKMVREALLEIKTGINIKGVNPITTVLKETAE
ncbi:hypothetical protein CYCD_26790 [Tenuifilaceae bacterium CYCD]|nr:hypothetical protein CYCD_26790 [Tenuifilaceae bacterium CYCD]